VKHFPIFIALSDRRVVVSGGGDAAIAKLRLLLKTDAKLVVYAADPAPLILQWAAQGVITLVRRPVAQGDASDTALFYAAHEDDAEDARAAAVATGDGALVNIVDNLHDSQFITPAIVDRDPVVVAIGTQGAAPVLARAIKADLEEQLPVTLGRLARIGKTFRKLAEALPMGRKRRDFWADYYFNAGPRAMDLGGADAVQDSLDALLASHLNEDERPGHVAFVGTGPGDPELLTLKARKALDRADVVIHDPFVTPEILELARREATVIKLDKSEQDGTRSQEDISALILRHAKAGAQVVRLSMGDPSHCAQMSAASTACDRAHIGWHVVPGITAAPAPTTTSKPSGLRLVAGRDLDATHTPRHTPSAEYKTTQELA